MATAKHLKNPMTWLVGGSFVLTLLAESGCSPGSRHFEPVEGTAGQGGEAGQGNQGDGGSNSGPCSEHVCGPNAHCVVVENAPTCECDDGYELEGDDCEDVDECAQEDRPCDAHATCENQPGSYSCTCEDGYFGDGARCWPLTQLVSVSLDGGPGNGDSTAPAVSADGRFVAFASEATNLVAGDTNGVSDVFVRDMIEGTTVRVSVSSDGEEGDDASGQPSISADGRYVVFTSKSTNFFEGTTPNSTSVFVHDLQEQTTTLVSINAEGKATSGDGRGVISADGRFVAFQSSSRELVDGTSQHYMRFLVFLRDMVNGTTEVVSANAEGEVAEANCEHPTISGDGRFVGFYSASTNLGVPSSGTKVHVIDRAYTPRTVTHATTNQSGAGGTGYYPALSANGKFVAFYSLDSDLVTGDSNGVGDIFVRDFEEGVTRRVSLTALGTQANGTPPPSISGDGARIAFVSGGAGLIAGDNNGVADIFVRDVEKETTFRVSIGSMGEEADEESNWPAISDDGNFVAFETAATTFGYPAGGGTQIYLRAIPAN